VEVVDAGDTDCGEADLPQHQCLELALGKIERQRLFVNEEALELGIVRSGCDPYGVVILGILSIARNPGGVPTDARKAVGVRDLDAGGWQLLGASKENLGGNLPIDRREKGALHRVVAEAILVVDVVPVRWS
jgi:hypothetical protein